METDIAPLPAATAAPAPERKKRQPRDPDAAVDNGSRVKLTPEGAKALTELRTLMRFAEEEEADVISPLIVAERNARVAKLKGRR